MWVLPTYARPGRCQDALDSIMSVGCETPGIVVVDGCPAEHLEAYRALRLPPGWQLVMQPQNHGVCETLNLVLDQHRHEPWYGFLSDDSLVRTSGWDGALVRAAGNAGFANSGDNWQAHKRMHGAVVFGGDLVRALGWWAPPGLRHSFVDDAWERIGKALDNWRHVPQALVEHRHVRNLKAVDDIGYQKAYETFEADRAVFRKLTMDEIPAAIARAIPVVVGDDPQRQRLARARSRSVMICTPVARHPCFQYTLALSDTVLQLERSGIEHARQFVIGSSNLPRARNELVARFLASRCTDLLFIDDDMGWKPDVVIRLLASDKPIAAAVGRKKVEKPNSDGEVWCGAPDCAADGELVQDDMGFVRFQRVGTGFMKISRAAFEMLIAAHPDWKRSGHAGMNDDVKAQYYRFFKFGDDEFETGEDFGFCNAWREIGGEIWIDPEAELSHVGDKAYTGAICEVMQAAEGERTAA